MTDPVVPDPVVPGPVVPDSAVPDPVVPDPAVPDPAVPGRPAPDPAVPDSALDIVVVGGGVAGLVTARALAISGAKVTLIEAAARLGGSVATHTVAGIRLDSGAESFATRRGTVARLLDELGLGDDVVLPNPAGAWVQLPGRAIPLPRTALLGIPANPRDPELRDTIGRLGAARASLDRVLPGSIGARSSTLGELVRARMGHTVLDRLVAPIVLGVHSAHPDDVDADVVAPGLLAGLRTHGSLAASVARLRASAPAGSAVAGISGGMYRLVEELAIDLRRRGVEVIVGVPVTTIRRHRDRDGAVTGDDWHVDLADGRSLDPARVVLTLPPDAILPLFGSTLPQSLATLWPAASTVDLATLVIDTPPGSAIRSALDAAPRGTGVLVSEDAPGVRAKALTHLTAKWPWLADAAAGRHVLRLSYGRAGDAADAAGAGGAGRAGDAGGVGGAVADLPDEELRGTAIADASALLGIPLAEDDVVGFARTRWTNAVPFAARGQRARVAAVRAEVQHHPGLEVTGAWVAGTGLASVVADAEATAARVTAFGGA